MTTSPQVRDGQLQLLTTVAMRSYYAD